MTQTTNVEGAWLLERGDSQVCEPLYWCGRHDWDKDHYKAVRFSRKEDAESASEYIEQFDDATYKNRVCFHEWG